MPIQQSFCYPIFREEGMDLAALFKLAHDIGYAATEFWQWKPEDEAAIKIAQDHGLVVASVCGHTALGDGLNKPDNHDRIEAELRTSIDFAVKHRIPGLICFSGNRNAGQSDYEGMVACAQGLRRVAGYAEDKGVNLNVELLNSRVDHPGYQADRTDWGVALCEMVASPRVKLLFDIYHMQIMEGDVIRSIGKHAAHIGHFHTAGNPGRHEIDDRQELNYRGICRAIADSGYTGYVGHELFPTGDKLDALRSSFEACVVE